MQYSFGTPPGSNDETVCLVDSVESHVPEEDDSRKVDIRTVRASNASELSPHAMAKADWDSPHPIKSCQGLNTINETVLLRACLSPQPSPKEPSPFPSPGMDSQTEENTTLS